MKHFLSVLLSFLLCFGLKAQAPKEATNKPGRYCATDELHHQLIQSDSAYASRVKQLDTLLYKRHTTKNHRTEINTTIYTIPVVIHIIHDNSFENISDQQVMDGLKHLNDAYRHISPFDGEGGADIGIQFCLATQDPLGNSSTGILRTQSVLTNVKMGNDKGMKNLSRWDSRKYLNIWLVREICQGEECRVNGYATYPYNHGNPYDGLVIKALQFGRWENLSKIPIHEIGHYFNLAHTFGSCLNDDCRYNGDGVCDTPPDRSMDEIPCGTSMNSCTTDEDDHSLNNPFRPIALGGIGEQNDQTQNYMDYGNLDCINLFTEGQKGRMIDALLNVRSSLLNSTGCQTPCPFNVSFTSSASSIDIDQTITFSNTSAGGFHFKWEIDDVQFSTTKNTTYTFHVKGTHIIRLYASNEDSSCLSSTSIQIRVIPPCILPNAYFVSSPSPNPYIKPGTACTFYQPYTDATDWKWYVNGNESSSTYTFTELGVYTIKLVAINYDISCADSSEMIVDVRSPCPSMRPSFMLSSSSVDPGDVVSFTNTTTNATRFSWKIDGTEFSNQANPEYAFNESGTHSITLYVSNNDSSCMDYTSSMVYVRCIGLHASLNVPTSAHENTMVHFSNTSTSATSFVWKIDGQRVSTNTEFTKTFDQPGIHEIKLLAYQGIYGCLDSAVASINILPYCHACFTPRGFPLKVKLGSTHSFMNTCSTSANLMWTIDGMEYDSLGNILSYLFTTKGHHKLVLTVYNRDSTCTDSLSTDIEVIDEKDSLIIPNLITANDDGLNDTFQVQGLSSDFTLEIYNQWDALVYKKEHYDNSFAAEGLNSNIYFYNLYHPETGQSYRGWLHVVK